MPIASVVASPGRIRPGQTFNLLWMVCPDRGATVVPAQTITLTINGTLVFPLSLPGMPDEDAPGSPARPAVSGTVLVDIDRLRRAGALDGFYRIGRSNSVSLRARATGSDLSASATIEISGSFPMPEISFAGPAAVASPGPYSGDVRSALWKQPYTVVVRLQNNPTTTMNYFLSLREAENTREPETGVVTNVLSGLLTPIEAQSVMLTPSESRDLSFTPITKQWPWLTAVVWIVTGPTVRGFTYDLRLTATDEFGNAFPAVNSAATIRVEVSVSEQKINLYMAALGLAITAGVLAVAGWFWPPALVASGVAYAGATAFGMNALDPPTPDPNFDESVQIEVAAIAAHLDKLGLKALEEWLRAMLTFAATRQALYLIEAKILGAQSAGKAESEKARVADYVRAMQDMASQYSTMTANVRQAIVELEGKNVSDEAISEQLSDAQLNAIIGTPPAGDDGELVEKAGIALSDLQQRVLDLRPEQVSISKLLRGITLSVGRSLRSVIHDSAEQYAVVRPEYFGGKKA